MKIEVFGPKDIGFRESTNIEMRKDEALDLAVSLIELVKNTSRLQPGIIGVKEIEVYWKKTVTLLRLKIVEP